MSAIIACCPSTGSSLLRRILNRHSAIFCGSETSLLAKDALYTNWGSAKARILSSSFPGLLSAGWHHYRGIVLDEEYPLSNEEIKSLINTSDSFNKFYNKFFSMTGLLVGKKFWIEKTPSNAFTAEKFIKDHDLNKVLFITRHPLDTIASLTNRGMSVYNACSIYLLNNSQLLKLKGHARILMTRYEDLLENPHGEMQRILNFLGFEFESSILEPDEIPTGTTFMSGWNYKETDKIQKGSIGRFSKISEEKQKEIISTLESLQLGKKYPYRDIQHLSSALGYNYETNNTKVRNTKVAFAMLNDKVRRTLKMSYFNQFNYPIHLK